MKVLRSVIVLDPTLKIDEVDVPYKSFIEQYKGSIIKRIRKERGWTDTKATNFLASKFNYDDYVYRVMCDVIREDEPKLILNRNPTITYGSILLMKIRRVKPDPQDLTLAIPSAILPGLQVYAQALSPGLPNTYLTAGITYIHSYQIMVVTHMMARGNVSRYGKK